MSISMVSSILEGRMRRNWMNLKREASRKASNPNDVLWYNTLTVSVELSFVLVDSLDMAADFVSRKHRSQRRKWRP